MAESCARYTVRDSEVGTRVHCRRRHARPRSGPQYYKQLQAKGQFEPTARLHLFYDRVILRHRSAACATGHAEIGRDEQTDTSRLHLSGATQEEDWSVADWLHRPYVRAALYLHEPLHVRGRYIELLGEDMMLNTLSTRRGGERAQVRVHVGHVEAVQEVRDVDVDENARFRIRLVGETGGDREVEDVLQPRIGLIGRVEDCTKHGGNRGLPRALGVFDGLSEHEDKVELHDSGGAIKEMLASWHVDVESLQAVLTIPRDVHKTWWVSALCFLTWWQRRVVDVKVDRRVRGIRGRQPPLDSELASHRCELGSAWLVGERVWERAKAECSCLCRANDAGRLVRQVDR